MAGTEVFDRVVLPTLVRLKGHSCPACGSTDIRGRTHPSELYAHLLVCEEWCVRCRKMISEDEEYTLALRAA